MRKNATPFSSDPGRGRLALALGGLVGMCVGVTGCIEDTDCGVCDPDNLVLESIAGINYASDKVNILGPSCEGGNCPGDIAKGTYFIEEIGPCEETEEAKQTPDAAEYCRLSPLITAFGLEFIFNNLLDATSIELVRKRPDNPNLFEVYDWKPDILRVEGPITRYNGDYIRGGTDRPDEVTRLVNLTCAENVDAAGGMFSHEDYQDPATNPCNTLQGGKPMKMRDGVMTSYRGQWSSGSGSCSSPEEGPDTCCTRCDWLLSTKVARYGLSAPAGDGDQMSDWRDAGLILSPNDGSAIECLTGGSEEIPDVFEACAGFNIGVDRSDEEKRWHWDDEAHRLPRYDYLRTLHPNERLAQNGGSFENETAKCNTTADCADVHNLPGTQCIGRLDSPTGDACLADATKYSDPMSPDLGRCVSRTDDPATDRPGTCQPQWFVTCRSDADTTGGDTAYCMDRRFGSAGTAACHIATARFRALITEDDPDGVPADSNTPLAFCDGNENNRLTATECCQDSLGGPADACDPFYQSNLTTTNRRFGGSNFSVYGRDANLPQSTRDCLCMPLDSLSDAERTKCENAIKNGCYDSKDEFIDSRRGQYAVKFVTRVGGVVYDPALKGFAWRAADTGNVGRADIEACAEGNVDRLISVANRHDGWRANDTGAESNVDYDRALCSGQTYTVRFSDPGGDDPWIRDKVGNTLEGKSVYTFETSQFHVVPDSGFPTDNLRIGACDDFSLRFSNKYDMSPENLAKLKIFRINDAGDLIGPNDDCSAVVPVAGGAGCVETKAELDALDDACAPPCLTIDVGNQFIGEVGVAIDPAEFGPVLRTGDRYRVIAPSLQDFAQAESDPQFYADAFWDVCGMPLVSENALRYSYEFAIDRPKCKEDADQDNVQLSCDNAPDFFNPDQGDIDGDGVGDVIDLCPTVAGSTNNSADSDRDGVGNECDSCRQTLNQYNGEADALGLPAYMWVRNIPYQTDTDEDGIGDVCDNCIFEPNCQEYGPSRPYRVGDPIAFDDDNICQRDDNLNMIGDVCDGGAMLNAFAAGPIGLGPLDDFDQDGIDNESDACPRQPLTDTIMCETDADCPENRACELYDGQMTGICDHLDSDEPSGDGVGDICDTCPFTANPMQVMEGGMQSDDEDGDFVGATCETTPQCADTEKDPRPFGFYDVANNGFCCTVALIVADDGTGDLLNAYTGNPLLGPHPEDPTLTVPVRETCSQAEVESFVCKALPARVASAPGILTPPPGCDDALAAAGTTAAENLANRRNDIDFDGDLDALWQTMCFLPQFDQDFDGLGDACDLCPFDFDPENLPYIDVNGRVWPNDGKFCNGEYSIDNKCSDETEPVDTDGGTDGETDGTGTGGTGGSGTDG